MLLADIDFTGHDEMIGAGERLAAAGRSDARLRARHVVQMQRSESRAESSLSGYAERRMHSNIVQMQNAKCKMQNSHFAFFAFWD